MSISGHPLFYLLIGGAFVVGAVDKFLHQRHNRLEPGFHLRNFLAASLPISVCSALLIAIALVQDNVNGWWSLLALPVVAVTVAYFVRVERPSSAL